MHSYKNYKYFYNPSEWAQDHLMVCDGLGYETHQSFLIDRQYFNNNLIMYVIRGELYVEQFRKTVRLTSGEGILMDLTQKHKYYFDKTIPSEMIWFHFRGNPCKSLIDQLNQNYKLPLFFYSNTIEKEIYDLFEITKHLERENEYVMSSKLYSLLMPLMSPRLIELREGNSQVDQFEYEVIQYIKNHIEEKFSLTEVAKAFNMSKYHFCRAFTNRFECSLFEYIRNEKIALAQKMLLSTNDSIAEIANYLNYCDQGYFSTTFKNVVGCAPKVYKKRHTSHIHKEEISKA